MPKGEEFAVVDMRLEVVVVPRLRHGPGSAPGHTGYGSFVSFRDLDGNGWFVQEITARLPGRVTPA
jgi:hypothetical protein